MSSETFKRLVKVKARELAHGILVQKQAQHSKMDAHIYPELKPQKYLSLKGARIEQIRNIFRFRTKMANFGDNFRNNRASLVCPLCKKHYDSQALSFQCEYYRDKLEITCNMSDIYCDEISLETARTITDLMNLRAKQIEENNNQ